MRILSSCPICWESRCGHTPEEKLEFIRSIKPLPRDEVTRPAILDSKVKKFFTSLWGRV